MTINISKKEKMNKSCRHSKENGPDTTQLKKKKKGYKVKSFYFSFSFLFFPLFLFLWETVCALLLNRSMPFAVFSISTWRTLNSNKIRNSRLCSWVMKLVPCRSIIYMDDESSSTSHKSKEITKSEEDDVHKSLLPTVPTRQWRRIQVFIGPPLVVEDRRCRIPPRSKKPHRGPWQCGISPRSQKLCHGHGNTTSVIRLLMAPHLRPMNHPHW